MKIAILNFILSTAVDGKIIRRKTNRDTMIYNMARGFVANGHEVTLLASEEYKPLEEETNDFEVVFFPSSLPRICKPALLPYPKGLAAFLRKKAETFDMILAVETFSIPTLIASLICPKKMLIWQEVGVHQNFAFKLPAKIWCHVIARGFMRNIPIVTMSPDARKFVNGFMGNVRKEVVAHGADSEVFYPVDDTEPHFIVISMLIRRKRVDTIISAFADYLQKYPSANVRLKIVGEGPEEESLKRMASNLGISKKIDFLGFLPHKEFAKLERKAIALLVNTASDLNMVSVTEAIANGTPVLMNSIPNTASYVRDYELGIVHDNWGAEELNEMTQKRETFHNNCVDNCFTFTNKGVARKLVDIFIEEKQKVNR